VDQIICSNAAQFDFLLLIYLTCGYKSISNSGSQNNYRQAGKDDCAVNLAVPMMIYCDVSNTCRK
jgi:hypothetical protein